MRWLEDFRDDTERRVREALDVAASRNDDLALRRVWSRLSDMVALPRPRLRRPALVAAALLGAVGGGAVLLLPVLREARTGPNIISASTSVTRPPVIPLPAVRDAPPPAPRVVPDEDPTPVLMGPAIVRTGLREGSAVRLHSGARMDLRARTTLIVDAGQRPVLRRGRAQLVVPKQPPGESFTVAAGPYVVVVVGTRFSLGVTPKRVEVEVGEGLVEIWRGRHRIRLGAGGSWKGPNSRAVPARRRAVARVTASTKPAPAPSPLENAAERYQEAKAALARGDSVIALGMWHQLAEGTGPAAENSSYEIGRVLRDLLYQPRQAIVVWSRYRERFPDGLLRHETDLSIIETLIALGDRAAARTEVEGFLRRHPRSDRYPQMKDLATRLAGAPAGGGPGSHDDGSGDGNRPPTMPSN